MSEENRVEEHEPTYETAAEPEMPSKFQTEPEPGYEMGYLVDNVPGDEEVGKLEPLTREAQQELKNGPFQVYQDAKGEWRWRLLSPENGLILGDSAEGYYSKSGAQRASLAARGTRMGTPSTPLGRSRSPDSGPISNFQTVSEGKFREFRLSQILRTS